MGVSIAYASTLARDFLIRIEADPEVAEIYGQPEKIIWCDGSVRRDHYPDFLVVLGSRHILCKIERAAKAPQVASRTAAIQLGQARLGREYIVVTETPIRAEPEFGNARLLMNGRRQLPMPSIRQAVAALVADGHGQVALRDAAIGTGASLNGLYAMILTGIIELERPREPLTPMSAIRMRSVR